MNLTSPLELMATFDLPLPAAETNLTTVVLSSFHAQGVVSDKVVLNFMIVYRWLGIALCIVPLVFSMINASVYWQHKRASHGVHLMGICAGDGFCVLMSLIAFMTALWQPPSSQAYQIISWYLASYAANSCRRAAICLNLLVSLERFLAVAFPLKDFSKRVAGKPKLKVLVVFVLSFAAHAYFLLEFRVVMDSEGKWKTSRTSLAIDNSLIFLGWSIVVTIFFACIPLFLSLMLNVALVMGLRKHRITTKSLRVSAGGTKQGLPQPTVHTEGQVISLKDSRPISFETSHFTSTSTQSGSFASKESVSDKNIRSHGDQSVNTMVLVFSFVYAVMVLPRMLHLTARALIPEYAPSSREHNLYTLIDIFTQIWAHLTEVEQFCLSFIYSRQFRKATGRLFIVRIFCGSFADKQSVSSSTATSQSSYM